MGTRCTSNKQNVLAQFIWAQICVVRGTVSLTSKGDGACTFDMGNNYLIYASRTAGDYKLEGELLMFYSFTSKSVRTKS